MISNSASASSFASGACSPNSCAATLNRNSFEPWEIDLLMDFETCRLPSRRRTEILRQYQRAVERQMESGAGPPMKLSRFLVLREQRRSAATPSPE